MSESAEDVAVPRPDVVSETVEGIGAAGADATLPDEPDTGREWDRPPPEPDAPPEADTKPGEDRH